MRLRCWLAVMLLLAAPAVLADPPGVYVIRGGTVHPASGPAVTNGIVVIRGGLIEAVGANVAVPPEAMPIDANGAHVYPGLIDAHSSLGFAVPAAGGRERAAEPGADSVAARNVKLSDADLDAARATGITTIVAAPAHGIFNGQSAVLNLGDGPMESRVVRSPAATHLAFNPRRSWTYPDSLMGVVAFMRQTFLDAQQHGFAREVYARTPSGLQRPPDGPALEALGPALRRELPVVFAADSQAMIRRALALAAELNLRPVIAGARQAHGMAGELRIVPLLVSVKWPVAPAKPEDREEQPLRVIRERQLAPTTPAVLAKGGVTFALVSGAGKPGDLLPGIRKAIDNGLTAEEALRATTLTPARIFGVDRQLGSLERGKIANVVITDKPLFEKDAKVTRVFIDGREIRLPAPEKKPPTEPQAAGIDGTWAVTVRTPQGNVALQMTLRAESGRVTGTFSGDRGSGDIRSGTVTSTGFELTIAMSTQNEADASDWAFKGTIDGSAMKGTVATNLGNFEFSGSRSE